MLAIAKRSELEEQSMGGSEWHVGLSSTRSVRALALPTGLYSESCTTTIRSSDEEIAKQKAKRGKERTQEAGTEGRYSVVLRSGR
jgi:hypothetical protein